jgi:uncharacterized protein YjbI with pentapeptide repeats
MKINWTRKNKIWTGIGGLVVAVLAALLVFSFVGIPGGGKLLGEVTISGNRISLNSDWWGLCTGVITLKNETAQPMHLLSFDSDGVQHAGDTLNPGETKSYDYKGSWTVTSDQKLPTIIGDRGSGGGAGEGGLRMGPYGDPVEVGDGHCVWPGIHKNGECLAYYNMEGINISGATFVRVDLSYSNLTNVEASNCKLIGGCYIGGANLYLAKLSGSDMSDIDCSSASFHKANLFKAILTNAWCFDADFSEANLTEANMSGADLSCAKLIGTNLTRANLEGADLSYAFLNGANLTGANLKGVDLSYAVLEGADLTNADLTGAIFKETVMPDGTKRSN